MLPPHLTSLWLGHSTSFRRVRPPEPTAGNLQDEEDTGSLAGAGLLPTGQRGGELAVGLGRGDGVGPQRWEAAGGEWAHSEQN